MKKKKRPRHAFVDIGQLETCAKFQQKYWTVRALSKFLYGNCITWLVLSNHRKISQAKPIST